MLTKPTEREISLSVIRESAAEGETIVAEGLTFPQYLTRFDGRHAEWLMGKVIVQGAKNKTHQDLILFLASLLRLYLGFKPIGHTLLAGFTMYVGDDRPAREPDLFIVLNENRPRIQPTYLDGPADIAIEVVSPESQARDYDKKFIEYEFSGVREYWLIDPLRQQADIYRLGDDQRYHRADLDNQGRLVSALLPGFALDPNVFWQDTLPKGPALIQLVQQFIA